jgi:DtxR family Mn-dependent transcriptional regulator
MLKRLAELGLLRYRKYGEIALTSQGEQRAHQVVRRHRLTERLLTDLLDVPLDQAHEEACLLEHAVSPSLETRIEKALGGPDACPHGHPIDASADDHTISLLEAPLSRALRVIRLQDEQPEVVRYLARAGLLPGARVKIAKRDPFSGAISLEIDDQSLTLGPQLAASVRVEQPRRRA